MALIDLEGPLSLSETDAFSTADLPGIGDTSAGGGGMTTSSMTNQASLVAMGADAGRSGRSGTMARGPGGTLYDVNSGARVGKAVTPALSGNPQAEHPFWTVILILLVLGLMKFIPHEEHEDSKPIKISLQNIIRITLLAMLGFLFLKWFFGIYQVASISPTIEFV